MSDSSVRMIVFILVFTVLGVIELYQQDRELKHSKRQRWINNLGIFVVDVLLLRVAYIVGASYVATLVDKYNIGLFNFLNLANSFQTLLTILFLDYFIYVQHLYSHRIDFLWRFHRTHHYDEDLDLTTALRFHPLEIFFSMIYKGLLIVFFGMNLSGVFLFELILNASAMFNHSNIKLSPRLSKILEKVIITPRIHEMHHSKNHKEMNSNFGFFLIWWDQFFHSFKKYRSGVELGINNYSIEDENILKILKDPFKG